MIPASERLIVLTDASGREQLDAAPPRLTPASRCPQCDATPNRRTTTGGFGGPMRVICGGCGFEFPPEATR